MSKCQHKYKDTKRTCPNISVKGCILCRKHKYEIKKNPHNYNILRSDGKIKSITQPPKEEPKNEDVPSLVTILEDEEVDSLIPERCSVYNDESNDDINITREFVFKCIDQYFETHNKRNELLKDMNNSKKSSGLDLNTLLGIGGMSLIPMLGQYMKQNMSSNNINNNGSDIKEPFIRVDKPTRNTAEENSTDFIKHDNAEEAKFTKV